MSRLGDSAVLAALGRGARGIMVALVLTAYPAAAFYPYAWEPPRVLRNTAMQPSHGDLRFAAPGPGIARSSGPPGWIATAAREHHFDVDLRVRSASPYQRGPARILTLSRDPRHRNVTIGQDGADLILRIRTPRHTLNGLPQIRVPGVFGTPRWVDLRVQVEPGLLQVMVDGATRAHARLPGAPLAGWDHGYVLALGNEVTGDRPWIGEIRRAAVTVGDERVDYAARGALEIPPRLWYVHRRPQTALLQNLKAGDVLVNVVGFVPLGLLAGVWARRARSPARRWLGLAAIIAMSVTLESVQFYFPNRVPSVNDLLFNTLGGVLGFLAMPWLARFGRNMP